MKTKVVYEWDVETPEPDDSDIAHNFGTLTDCLRDLEVGSQLVLVRSVWDVNDEGLIDRSWSYVVNGTLPEYFSQVQADGKYWPINIKVPARFHSELSKTLKGNRATHSMGDYVSIQ